MRLSEMKFDRMFSQALPLCLALLGLGITLGCERTPSAEELGEIHYHLPPINGMETRYYLPPQLKSNTKQLGSAEQTASSSKGAGVAAEEALPAEDAAGQLEALFEDSPAPPDAASAEPTTESSAEPPLPEAASEPNPEKSTAP